jgi:hypothetical protein
VTALGARRSWRECKNLLLHHPSSGRFAGCDRRGAVDYRTSPRSWQGARNAWEGWPLWREARTIRTPRTPRDDFAEVFRPGRPKTSSPFRASVERTRRAVSLGSEKQIYHAYGVLDSKELSYSLRVALLSHSKCTHFNLNKPKAFSLGLFCYGFGVICFSSGAVSTRF